MEKIQVDVLIEQAMVAMRIAGLSEHAISKQHYCGKIPVLRHFKLLGESYYSESIVNQLVLQKREEYECGKYKYVSWRILRKFATNLQEFCLTGKVSIRLLPSWNTTQSFLRKPPTPQSLKDKTKITVLVYLARQAVQKAGIKTLNSGFDCLLLYYDRHKITNYSTEHNSEFVKRLRQDYENGHVNKTKWNTCRKAAAITDVFFVTGEVETGVMPRWNEMSAIKQRQMINQFKDKNDIFTLAHLTEQELYKQNIAQKTIDKYTRQGIDYILRYCMEHNIKAYSKGKIDRYIADIHTQYESGLMGKWLYRNIRKAAFLMDECYETGKLVWKRIPSFGLRYPNDYYSRILSAFLHESVEEGVFSNSSAEMIRSGVRRFLFILEDAGFSDFTELTHKDINNCALILIKSRPNCRSLDLFTLRAFSDFLFKHSMTGFNFKEALPECTMRKREIREGFTPTETKALLSCPDRSTVIGMRDYAIMMLAVQSGLRAIDIVNLRRQDIDWRKNEIHIVQQKTNRPLSLPLGPETGNAIADYLLHGRPNCELSYVFLCWNLPFRKLNNRSAGGIVKRIMASTGVVNNSTLRHGFHSFRRSFGKQLLEKETPIEMLSSLLGHANIDSTKPYLAVDAERLRACALSLDVAEKAGEKI